MTNMIYLRDMLFVFVITVCAVLIWDANLSDLGVLL